jgi:geranylgeranyl pyrophosphate synthase
MRDASELKRLFINGAAPGEDELRRALELVRRPNVLRAAQGLAADQIGIARELLATLPPSPYRDALRDLTDEQLARDS